MRTGEEQQEHELVDQKGIWLHASPSLPLLHPALKEVRMSRNWASIGGVQSDVAHRITVVAALASRPGKSGSGQELEIRMRRV